MPEPVVTPHTPTPQQAAQADEGAMRTARAQSEGRASIPAGERDVALHTGEGGDPPESGRQAPPQPQRTTEPPERQAPVVGKTPGDVKRDEMISRFRQDRATETNEDTAVDEFSKTGMPPELVEAPAVEQQAEPAPAEGAEPQPEAPRKFTVKVGGKTFELTEEEIVANAQIALAADNILDTAKNKLKDIEILEQQMAQRRGQVAEHQRDPSGEHQPATQPARQTAPAGSDAQHQGEDLTKLIEAIQLGDPTEAATLLQNTIAAARTQPQEVAALVEQKLVEARLRDEGARTAKVLEDFKVKHKDLAEDPDSSAVIEATMFRLQAEDLRAIGLDPTNLRTDGQPTSKGDVAAAHRWYRSNGMKVRPPEELLSSAVDHFTKWKGGPSKEPPAANPAQPTNPAAPRVEVTVNRETRRASVTPQPTRTAQPAPVAQQQPQQPRDRSSVVADMQRSRAAKRGTTFGLA